MAMADRYAEIHAGHRWEVPAQFNIAHACCARWAGDRARFALYWEDESGATSAHTFWDLAREANRLSNVLANLGVARGDKVALILPQRRETIVAHLAVYQLGAVAVPLSFLFGPDALEYRLDNSRTRVAIVDPQSLPNILPIRDKLEGLTHVVGRGGRERRRHPRFRSSRWARRRRSSARFKPAPTTRRSSCTRAAPPARPKAR